MQIQIHAIHQCVPFMAIGLFYNLRVLVKNQITLVQYVLRTGVLNIFFKIQKKLLKNKHYFFFVLKGLRSLTMFPSFTQDLNGCPSTSVKTFTYLSILILFCSIPFRLITLNNALFITILYSAILFGPLIDLH